MPSFEEELGFDIADSFQCSRSPDTPPPDWKEVLAYGIQLWLDQTARRHSTIEEEHIAHTPERVVRAFASYTEGCAEDPRVYLQKKFSAEGCDQMVTVLDKKLVSLCAHHAAPILGTVDFAYVPDKFIVGFSKIPRFIRSLSRRPQVQEKLSHQIVDMFQEAVQPKGCAVRLRAYHCCMMLRGVEEPASYAMTTALTGIFHPDSPNYKPSAKMEFLQGLDNSRQIFP